MKQTFIAVALVVWLANSRLHASAQVIGLRVTKQESDAAKPGKVAISGVFSTAANVTLDGVKVTLFPINGGRVLPAVESKVIDKDKKTFGPVALDDVPSENYIVLVEGHFSDKSHILEINFRMQLTWGDPPVYPVTIGWEPGSPDNIRTPPQSITATGPYKGKIDPKKPALLYVIPRPNSGREDMGGPATTTKITFDDPNAGAWSAKLAELPVGVYHVFAIVTGVDGHRYCTPYANSYSLPKTKTHPVPN